MNNGNRLPHGHDYDPAKIKNKWGLTPKQEQFCHAYLIDLSIAKAERLAGLSPGTGKKLMKKSAVLKRIAAIRLDTGKALDVTRERLLQELMLIATQSSEDIIGKDPEEWESDVHATVSEVEYDTLIGGIRRVKRYDKLGAIAQVAKMLGFNMPDVVVNKNTNLNLNTEPIDRKDAVRIAKDLEELL